MQNVELRDYPKDGNVTTAGVDDLPDSDIQQVEGKNYDPTPDKRDMRRLGKRQELKVRNSTAKMVQDTQADRFAIAAVSILLNRRIRDRARADMGVLTRTGRLLIIKRWCCRSHLAHFCCVLGNGNGHAFNGRDGIDGTNIGRYRRVPVAQLKILVDNY